jgi:protein-tyrosine phosphatase
MGSSRSATIVIYYLMKKYNMTLEESINFVKEKRNIVNLTNKFCEELQFKNIN